MNEWTRKRIRTSISVKATLFGIVVALGGLAVGTLFQGEVAGSWAGILGLTGAYIALFAVVVFGLMELLRLLRV